MTDKKDLTLLVVDDEESIRSYLRIILEEEGWAVLEAATAKATRALFEQKEIHLVLLDARLPDADGLDLLSELKGQTPEVEILVVSGSDDVPTAVEAMRRGAYGYLLKPFQEEVLLQQVERMAERVELEREVYALRRRLRHSDRYSGIVGRSRQMEEVFALLDKIALTETNVLIAGETGTGKELVARTLHQNSNRASAPFVALNCAAIPEALLESELFGYEKGAFTGAVGRKDGMLTRAHGGTLFLDEIGDMPLALQAKLLRVIQEREFTPLGSTQSKNIDMRLVSASNQNLKAMVAAGAFREDLYYRVNVVEITIPPLRDRREDIPLLAEAFLQKKDPKKMFHPSALQVMLLYSWPGNVRELQNVVERSAALCSGEVIRTEDLPQELKNEAGITVEFPTDYTPSFKRLKAEYMKMFDVAFINRAMARTGGNVTEAAAWMGIGRTALQALLRKYGISSRSFRGGS